MRGVPMQRRAVPRDVHAVCDPFAFLDAAGAGAQGDGGAPAAESDGGAVGRTAVRLVILGEPASKANSRQLVKFGERMVPIKSAKARNYERDAQAQIPVAARRMLRGPLRVTLRIWYASERPDLDESVILDVLQARYRKVDGRRELVRAGVYENDRQVRERHVFHGIDRANPRAEIVVEPLNSQPPATT
jgi:Holliday junction resolvase RusA-like endonuclease